MHHITTIRAISRAQGVHAVVGDYEGSCHGFAASGTPKKPASEGLKGECQR